MSSTRTCSQHSTADRRGQSADGHQSNAPGILAKRFGDLLAAGYTALPNALFEHQAALSLGDGEILFLQQLWSYWWGEAIPHPALPTLAARMGKSVRQLQYYVERLRRVGILRVIDRYDGCGRRLPNGYDLQPLLDALRTHCHPQEGEHNRTSGAPVPHHSTFLHYIPTDEIRSDTSATPGAQDDAPEPHTPIGHPAPQNHIAPPLCPPIHESTAVMPPYRGTVQPTSPYPVKPAAGKANQSQQDLDLDSIPPPPQHQKERATADTAILARPNPLVPEALATDWTLPIPTIPTPPISSADLCPPTDVPDPRRPAITPRPNVAHPRMEASDPGLRALNPAEGPLVPGHAPITPAHRPQLAFPGPPTAVVGPSPTPGSLRALVSRLGQLVGDASPRSTISRIDHIGRCYGLAEPILTVRLAEAADRMLDTGPEILLRTATGTPNGMPYLLTTLESLLQPTPEPSTSAPRPVSPPRPVQSRSGTYAPGRQDPGPSVTAASEGGEAQHLVPFRPTESPSQHTAASPPPVPLWTNLLAAMREIVAPGVQRVLEHELVATADSGSLILTAPSQFRAAWIERSLRRHLEDHLSVLSPERLTLRIVVAAARSAI